MSNNQQTIKIIPSVLIPRPPTLKHYTNIDRLMSTFLNQQDHEVSFEIEQKNSKENKLQKQQKNQTIKHCNQFIKHQRRRKQQLSLKKCRSQEKNKKKLKNNSVKSKREKTNFKSKQKNSLMKLKKSKRDTTTSSIKSKINEKQNSLQKLQHRQIQTQRNNRENQSHIQYFCKSKECLKKDKPQNKLFKVNSEIRLKNNFMFPHSEYVENFSYVSRDKKQLCSTVFECIDKCFQKLMTMDKLHGQQILLSKNLSQKEIKRLIKIHKIERQKLKDEINKYYKLFNSKKKQPRPAKFENNVN